MSNKYLKLSMGGDGTVVVSGTDLIENLNAQRLVMNEDSTFDIITDVYGNDLMAGMNMTVANLISKGIVLKPLSLNNIGSVKLASGSCVAIK